MEIDFRRIRPVGGTRHRGFEVLCCQLAEHDDDVPQGSRFFRREGSGGDEGVECYCILPDGSEWGWQAKHFVDRFSGSQWRQIDRSVDRAVAARPRLTRYFVCLPRDLKKAQEPTWERHVAKWQEAASAKSMNVQFEFWGEHQIVDRLRRPALAGATRWWFGVDELSEKWFRDRFEEVRKDIGRRYTPEVHVELPVSDVFGGLARTGEFFRALRSRHGALRRAWRRLREACSGLSEEDHWSALCESTGRLLSGLERAAGHDPDLGGRPFAALGIAALAQQAEEVFGGAEKCWRKLDEIRREREPSSGSSSGDSAAVGEVRRAASAAWEMYSAASAMRSFLVSPRAEACDDPVVAVLGKAGVGKTHLLCDVAARRVEQGLPTVLLRGIGFVAGRSPWEQMLQHLHLDCKQPEDFLGALQACADACNCRGLIMIDALNEGDGRAVWREYLRGMIATLKRFPGVGLAVSCRSSYDGVVLPQVLVGVQ